jgi:hypothetical protein
MAREVKMVQSQSIAKHVRVAGVSDIKKVHSSWSKHAEHAQELGLLLRECVKNVLAQVL